MKKRGVALIWALVLSAVLLIISTTMVSYIIKESQFTVRATESVQAYACAKSGIEWANYMIAQDENIGSTQDFDGDNEPETTITLVSDDGTNKLISSEATVNGVTRKIESRISPTSSTYIEIPSDIKNIEESQLLSVGANESFAFSFNFWGDLGAGDYVWVDFGINPYQPDSKSATIRQGFWLNFELATNNLKLVAVDSSNNTKTATVMDSENLAAPLNLSTDPSKTNYSNYKATIQYISETAAYLKIAKREIYNTPTGPSVRYNCIGYAELDLSGGESFPALNTLYWSATNLSNATIINVSDLKIGDKNNFFYIGHPTIKN